MLVIGKFLTFWLYSQYCFFKGFIFFVANFYIWTFYPFDCYLDDFIMLMEQSKQFMHTLEKGLLIFLVEEEIYIWYNGRFYDVLWANILDFVWAGVFVYIVFYLPDNLRFFYMRLHRFIRGTKFSLTWEDPFDWPLHWSSSLAIDEHRSKKRIFYFFNYFFFNRAPYYFFKLLCYIKFGKDECFLKMTYFGLKETEAHCCIGLQDVLFIGGITNRILAKF